MKLASLFLAFICLAACKEDVVQNTDPVPFNADSLGHFCQMSLLEHEGPKAQVHIAGQPGIPLFFSQVRDALAYLRMPEQSHEVLAVWVSDMGNTNATWRNPGTDNWIEASSAHYVIEGDALGGMGAPETVPFLDKASALDFADRHGGRVVGIDAIPDSHVLAPVTFTEDASEEDFQNQLRALSTRKKGVRQ